MAYPRDWFSSLQKISLLYRDGRINLQTRKAFPTASDLLLTIQTIWGVFSFFCCFFLVSISRLWSKIHPGTDFKSNFQEVSSGHHRLWVPAVAGRSLFLSHKGTWNTLQDENNACYSTSLLMLWEKVQTSTTISYTFQTQTTFLVPAPCLSLS